MSHGYDVDDDDDDIREDNINFFKLKIISLC